MSLHRAYSNDNKYYVRPAQQNRFNPIKITAFNVLVFVATTFKK